MIQPANIEIYRLKSCVQIIILAPIDPKKLFSYSETFKEHGLSVIYLLNKDVFGQFQPTVVELSLRDHCHYYIDLVSKQIFDWIGKPWEMFFELRNKKIFLKNADPILRHSWPSESTILKHPLYQQHALFISRRAGCWLHCLEADFLHQCFSDVK